MELLTLKTVFLVTLALDRRVSEVSALSGLPQNMRKERDGSVSLSFLPEFLAKNQVPGDVSPDVSLRPLSDIIDPSEPDYLDCTVRALRLYRQRSHRVRSLSQRVYPSPSSG